MEDIEPYVLVLMLEPTAELIQQEELSGFSINDGVDLDELVRMARSNPTQAAAFARPFIVYSTSSDQAFTHLERHFAAQGVEIFEMMEARVAGTPIKSELGAPPGEKPAEGDIYLVSGLFVLDSKSSDTLRELTHVARMGCFAS